MRRIHRSVARVKSIGFLIWTARHHLYHILIGLVWAWLLRELWNEFNLRWIVLSVLASEAPDIDHIVYFLTYGRKDPYSKLVRQCFFHKQWRMLFLTIDNGHKYNTNLVTHNYFTLGFFLVSAAVANLFEWQTAVVILGAIVLHYVFDIVDDLLILGSLNPNWNRWGRRRVNGKFQMTPFDKAQDKNDK